MAEPKRYHQNIITIFCLIHNICIHLHLLMHYIIKSSNKAYIIESAVMKNRIIGTILFSISIIFLVSFSRCSKYTTRDIAMINKAFKTEDIVSLFALTPGDIQNNLAIYLDQAQKRINDIITISDNRRT